MSIGTIPEPSSEYQPTPHRERYTHGESLPYTESLLWRSCLGQCIRDLSSTNPREREDVLEWMASEDFAIVCEYAEVDPEQMKEQMSALAAMPLILARKYGHMLKVAVMRGVHHG